MSMKFYMNKPEQTIFHNKHSSVCKRLKKVNNRRKKTLFYGDNDLTNDLNRTILELTLRFIYETGRFG